MALPQDHISMALFCDFENVALGVRDANYEKFDIKKVLERLLLKGSIVVKKAYCDWERYKGFKAAMHEANFELIEIPHVRQSGKNSADIRLVVDALDLCYTKSHVNTFVIISGDSDFSPLVSKLRENAKYVIGVGVKQSTSDLLIANCDEFIFYDDLVRDSQRQRRDNRDQPQPRRTPEEEARRKAELDARRTKAVEMAAETYEALVTDRDEGGKIWASVLKEAIKRRNPGFNENYYGFRTFGNLLEEAKARGLLEFGRDEKSSAYVFRGTGIPTVPAPSQINAPVSGVVEPNAATDTVTEVNSTDSTQQEAAATPSSSSEGRERRGQRGRGRSRHDRRPDAASAAEPVVSTTDVTAVSPPPAIESPATPTIAVVAEPAQVDTPRQRRRKSGERQPKADHVSAAPANEASPSTPAPAPSADDAQAPADAKAKASRPRRTRAPAAKKSSKKGPSSATE
ncbi:NYN domain-containing protein [Aquabacterium sp.]|uniref:NYN domain-containing protein n=1 Tax=Aquabacterium sp. TaxID=1872578 RepID=UPI003B74FF06